MCEDLPGKAIILQMLVRYIDGDLGQHNEYGTAVAVNPPGSSVRGPVALAKAAAFIHHLPADQTFTLEAGRAIWGVPKTMADFAIRESRTFSFDVSTDGQRIAGITFSPGLPVPTRGSRVLKTYSHCDNVTREIPWKMTISGMRARLGGARLRLGDHPVATELASLGLPKRAPMSQSAANVEMTSSDAHAV